MTSPDDHGPLRAEHTVPAAPKDNRAGRAVRPGPGSLNVLLWVARLGVAGVEPIQHALGLSRSTVYSHLGRLRDTGVVLPVAIYDGLGGVVAITGRGAQIARSHGIDAVQPRLHAAAPGVHPRAVSWVAAGLTRHTVSWLGPAEMRAAGDWRLTRPDGRGHLPDLGCRTLTGDWCAIEVELHAKASDRLRQILLAYQHHIHAGKLDQVTYVCDKPAVARLIEHHGRPVLGDALNIEMLPTWTAHTRATHSHEARS